MKRRMFVLVLLVILTYPLYSEPISFYVAPDGSDDNPGSQGKPFATLQKAKNRILQIKADANGLPGPVYVYLRGGTYLLDTPFILTGNDCGTANAPIIYTACKDENVSILGGKSVNGFKKFKGNILKADLTSQGLKDAQFEQLYYRNKAMPCARVPNADPQKPYTGGFTCTTADTNENTRTKLAYDPDMIKPQNWKHPEKAVVDIFAYPCYGNTFAKVGGVDIQNNILQLESPGIPATCTKGDRFYVTNVFEELDAPGEWYHDDTAGILYFYPPDSQKPENVEVMIPVAQSCIILQGTPDEPVSHISFEKINIGICKEDAVVMRNASYCTIAGCRISNTGKIGISLHENCSNNRIISNDITQTGGCPIRMIGRIFEQHRNAHNVFANNHLYDFGTIQKMETGGIYLIGSGYNHIANNLIHDCPRWGVALNVCNDTTIEYNHIYNVNHETEDSGAIMTVTSWGGWDKHFDHQTNDHIRGNIIRCNLVHDTGGYGRVATWLKRDEFQTGKWLKPYFTWGIYLDLASSGTTVYGNIVYNTFMGGFIIGGGQDNICENNIFVNSRLCQIYTCKWSDHYAMRRNHIRRNIIAYSDPNAHLYSNICQHGIPWVPYNIDYNSNLIWNDNRPITVDIMKGKRYKSLQDWQTTGMDTDSIVADPMFVDAEDHNYQLSPQSPAYTLGFERIPTERIGLYKDKYRK